VLAEHGAQHVDVGRLVIGNLGPKSQSDITSSNFILSKH